MIADERIEPSPPASGKVLELHPRNGSVTAVRSSTASASDQEPDSEKLFRLEVTVDMQRERELLYKVALVIEAIGTLMLVREWALWWFA